MSLEHGADGAVSPQAWHISEGLGVQFLEAKDQIKLPDASWGTTCSNWDKYWGGSIYAKQDSGL